MKRIGLLTSGGDAPGMNAAIRAVVRAACQNGMEVIGIERGYAGLIEDKLVSLTELSVTNIMQRGGTVLRTARCLEMMNKEGQEKAVATLKKHGIEGLVVVGGDGSFHGAKILSEQYGIPTIGIPGTIDNDLAYTDFTLGFDTAVNTCINDISKLRETMDSHERVCVVEVMGRHCGDIALYAALSVGAEAVVVPETEYSIEAIAEKIKASRKAGKYSNIVVLAEGVMSADEFVKLLKPLVPYDVRPNCIGHIQRGGSPTMSDRLLATECGVKAVELLKKGIGNRVIGIVDNKIVDMDIIEALSMPRKFNKKLYDMVNMLAL